MGTSCAVRIYGKTKLENKYKNTTRRRGLLPNMFWGLRGRERENLVHWSHAPKALGELHQFSQHGQNQHSAKQKKNLLPISSCLTWAVQPWEKTTPNNSQKSVSLWLSSSSLILTLCSAHLHSFYFLTMGFACSKQTCIFSLSRILSTAEFV